jgi:hypothetical protein
MLDRAGHSTTCIYGGLGSGLGNGAVVLVEALAFRPGKDIVKYMAL